MNGLGIVISIGFCIYSIYLARLTYLECHNVLKKILKEAFIIENKIKETVEGKNTDNINLVYNIAKDETQILEKHLKKYRQNILSNKQTERILEVDGYLSPSVLLSYYGKRKLAESIPGILTGIGILGTFLGLVIGIIQIDMENLKPSIQQLIGGMYIAFSSSVVAIFCSLIWSYRDRKFLAGFYEKLQSLVETISERLPIRNDSDVLEEIAAQQKVEIDTMRSFFSDVLIPRLVSGVGEAIKEYLSPEVEKMGQTVDAVAQFSTSRQAEGIQQLVDKISDVFDTTFERQFRELSESMNKITVHQAQAAEQLQDLLEYFEAQTREQATLVEQTKDLLKQLRGCLVDLRDAHIYLSENVEHLSKIHERLSTLQADVNDWVTTITTEQNRLVELREKQTEVVNNQISTLEEFWKSISKEITDLRNTLGESIEGFKNNIHNGLNRTFKYI